MSPGSTSSLPPQTFTFFAFDVTPQVFHHTNLSFAFINIRPLLPGHILISPIRPVVRLSELTDDEVADLFITVKRVARTLERVYDAPALTIPLQDGIEAGQTVPHLHVHILPRARLPAGEGDEKEQLGAKGLDEIYEKLEGEEGDFGAFLALREARRRGRGKLPELEGIPLRSMEDMLKEADMLRREVAKDEGERLRGF